MPLYRSSALDPSLMERFVAVCIIHLVNGHVLIILPFVIHSVYMMQHHGHHYKLCKYITFPPLVNLWFSPNVVSSSLIRPALNHIINGA